MRDYYDFCPSPDPHPGHDRANGQFCPGRPSDLEMPSDSELMRSLARHLRIHEVLCFDPDDQREQKRAEELVERYADMLAEGPQRSDAP